MKIFIVNLQSSVDRRERMKFLLAEKGITDYEFIEATLLEDERGGARTCV